MLAKELKELGAQNVSVSEFGIVYATLPGNLADNSKVPVIGFIAHMDTSPAVSGENVNVIIHKNYQGGDIVLPKDPTQVITVAKTPVLKTLIGDDIITADGTTLLGSDDKSGIAEIMTMVDTLIQNPQIKHGTLAIAFTPDEEVGGGIEKFDVKAFGAQFAYTVDGKSLGSINEETWAARTATVTFQGLEYASGHRQKTSWSTLPTRSVITCRAFRKTCLPETTEGRVGFVHPYGGVADIEQSSIKVLLRDFDVSGLDAKEKMLKDMVAQTQAKFPEVKISIDVKENYKNMKEELKKFPQLTENAFEAARRAGLKPFMDPIRGGTDGARLTFRGLPTPNLFTGGNNFHGKLEFNSRGSGKESTETFASPGSDLRGERQIQVLSRTLHPQAKA